MSSGDRSGEVIGPAPRLSGKLTDLRGSLGTQVAAASGHKRLRLDLAVRHIWPVSPQISSRGTSRVIL
ncbi:MAG TPA: hypothetical protein PLQ54_09590 [Armatimonadota bacterium]|nr:hypothetical protein [Armatimonadota bacterium]